MRRGLVVGAVAVVAIAVAVAGAVLLLDRPVVPTTFAGPEPIARTALLPPDPDELLPPGATEVIAASACLDRIGGADGYADLCWVAWRHVDEDPSRDYFTLGLGGTFGGPAVRWIAVEVRLVEGTAFPGGEGAPEGDQTGCVEVPPGGRFAPGAAPERLCGHIVAGPGPAAGGWRLSWACDPCLLRDDVDRAIGLQSQVIVAEGDLPNWDIHVALGR